jgi:hypothetical protein
MNEPEKLSGGEESHPPTSPEGLTENASSAGRIIQETRDGIDDASDVVLKRREQQLKELSAKREAKELSPHDFDLNFIFQLNEVGLPLTRKDMHHETGDQALVLTRENLEELEGLDFIHASGEIVSIEPESLDPNDVFILYPDEMGDLEQ